MIHCWWRRTTAKSGQRPAVGQRRDDEGQPEAERIDAASSAPRAAVPSLIDRLVMTRQRRAEARRPAEPEEEARAGARPPARRPAPCGSAQSRWSTGTSPANTSPRTIVRTPSTTVSSARCQTTSQEPSEPATPYRSRRTPTAKPSTNSTDPASIRPRRARRPGQRRRGRSRRRGSPAAAGSRRGEERDETGDQGDRDGQQRANRRPPSAGTSHPLVSPATSARPGRGSSGCPPTARADDCGGDAALLVEHEGASGSRCAEDPGEREQCLAARVVDRRVGHVERPDVGPAVVRGRGRGC